MLTRRSLVMTSVFAGMGLYTYRRGLRYPRLSFEHLAYADFVNIRTNILVQMSNAILLRPRDENSVVSFRAIAPEPRLTLKTHGDEKLTLKIINVATNTILEVKGNKSATVHENINGLDRIVEISFNGETEVDLIWHLPEQDGTRFAIIGDTGGGRELEWLLKRVAKLDVQFLLHLGDFNYNEGEYDLAIVQFNSSPVPCYVSIGNHDFNDSGLVYQQFIEQIGPMNHTFTFAGTRFVNIDSAVDFFPASAGRRGDLLNKLQAGDSHYFDQVYFTHRAFEDPREGRDHVIGGIGEIEWLHDKLQKLECNNLLTGHVHKSAELDYKGIHQWTIGEGLGFEDIVNQQQTAQLLIGTVEIGKKVSYQWLPIEMPWSYHTSPAHEIKLKLEHSPEKLEWYRQVMTINSIIQT